MPNDFWNITYELCLLYTQVIHFTNIKHIIYLLDPPYISPIPRAHRAQNSAQNLILLLPLEL